MALSSQTIGERREVDLKEGIAELEGTGTSGTAREAGASSGAEVETGGS